MQSLNKHLLSTYYIEKYYSRDGGYWRNTAKNVCLLKLLVEGGEKQIISNIRECICNLGWLWWGWLDFVPQSVSWAGQLWVEDSLYRELTHKETLVLNEAVGWRSWFFSTSALLSQLVELPHSMVAESNMRIPKEQGESMWDFYDSAQSFYYRVSPLPSHKHAQIPEEGI